MSPPSSPPPGSPSDAARFGRRPGQPRPAGRRAAGPPPPIPPWLVVACVIVLVLAGLAGLAFAWFEQAMLTGMPDIPSREALWAIRRSPGMTFLDHNGGVIATRGAKYGERVTLAALPPYAPKATLMSYIIKGILNQQLPWTLVILGAMIALVLELCGIAALPFAVGVYLPVSSSVPVFVGGMVRWLADRHIARRNTHRNLTPEELTAETDKSPGVLMASGYIAGGAIAGIGIAFISGGMVAFNQKITDVMTAHNPFFEGPWSDALAVMPFAAIMLALYLAGRAQRPAG